MNPYYLMTLLYLALAILAALDTSLVNLHILPAFPGQRWLLVHTVTLGSLVELVCGVAPDLTAALAKLPRPAFRWNIWFLLNSGLIVLYAGIPLVNRALIIGGGTLVFLAATLLVRQLIGLVRQKREVKTGPVEKPRQTDNGYIGGWYYLSGLSFLLVGILVGTGIWLGWAGPLHIVTPKEVHVHSNLWGFASIVFAGLLTDLYPGFTGRPLAKRQWISPIFWLMTLGALGMVLGPWVDINSFTVYGLVFHTIGTLLLLLNMTIPLWRRREQWTAGIWHIALAYVWFILAVVVAPLVVAGGAVGDEVAGSGGPILIFGWILQFGFALIPFLFTRAFTSGQPARLGGTWFTLISINLGNLLYWISMFWDAGRGPIRSAAYLFWIISLIPVVMALARMVSGRLEQVRGEEISI